MEMTRIAENIAKIRAALPDGVEMVAVSKLKPESDIMEAYGVGQRAFGENYATELRDKMRGLPEDIKWHMVGHLQGKQLKYYIDKVALIQGVDSVEHLADVDHAAAKAGRVVDVLLQVHVAEEETKFGFAPDELMRMAEGAALAYEHVRICGLMAMATKTEDEVRVGKDFATARRLFDAMKRGAMAGREEFATISMGMSHDWEIAVSEGSTLVRIGSSIFGARPARV